jgi:hypothetical protein
MMTDTQQWNIESRVANTQYWGVVASAVSMKEAIRIAESWAWRSVGVRIVNTESPYSEPIITSGN